MARKGTSESGGAATLASKAYGRLRHDIIEGRFGPGEKLRVRHLCKLYGMGITPVREALNRASRDGLVLQTDLRGFSAAPLSEADLDELTRTRCWLNEIALRRSIADGDAVWEENVVLAHYRLARTPRYLPDVADVRNPEWEAVHRAFHTALLAACGSARLVAFCEQLFDSATRYRFLWSIREPDIVLSGEVSHRRIMEATVARRADEAVRLLIEHFATATGRAMGRLRTRGVPGEGKGRLRQKRPAKA